MRRFVGLFILVVLCLGLASPQGLFQAPKAQAASGPNPTYRWHSFYGSGQLDMFEGVAVDSSGAIYLVGSANAGWPGPDGQTPLRAYGAGQDIMVLKLDRDGNYVWHTFLGSNQPDFADYGRNITIDSAGNLYVTGYSAFTWNYGTHVPLNAHTNGTDENIVVVKLDGNGGYLWHTFMGYGQGNGMTTDAANSVFVTGYSTDTWNGPAGQAPIDPFNIDDPEDGWDIVALKLTSDGAYQWHTFFGGEYNDAADGIVLDSSNNLYLAGFSYFPWDGHAGIPPRHAFSLPDDPTVHAFDIAALSLNANGVYRWHTFYGSDSDDFSYSLANDASGNLYIAGVSSAAWNNGTTGPAHPYNANGDIAILQLNSAGDYQRHAFYGSEGYDEAYFVTLGQDGYLYLTGQSQGNWSGIGGAAPLYPYRGGYDIFALKLDTNDNYQWHAYFGGSEPDGKDYSYVTADSQGNLYMAGFSSATWNGPASAAPLHAFSGGASDGVVIKMGYVETTTTVTFSPNPVVFGQPLTLTATVSATGATPTGGTVSFYEDTNLLQTVDLVNGVASWSQSFDPGTYHIIAEYSGDGPYYASEGTTEFETWLYLYLPLLRK
jgi:hypothetical protein